MMAFTFFFFSLMAVQMPQHHLLKGHLSYTVLHVHLCAKKKKNPQQIWYICVCLDSSMINLITCKQKCLFFLFYACVLSHVGLFATQWTEGCQAPLSMGFPRKGYWSGLTFPPPGDSSRARD